MYAKQSNATLQIQLHTQPDGSHKVAPDSQLKPVTRNPIPKPYAAKRRAEGRRANTYVLNAAKTPEAKGGYILKSLSIWM